MNDGSTEREHTPPISPRARGRARSASPSPVIQRQSPSELRDRNRSTHSNRSVDTRGDFSGQARDRDILVVDSSASRSSKAHDDSSGQANRESQHIQYSSTGATGESSTEDGLILHRSHSSRGRNRERESVPSGVDGRQELNQGQNLPASSTLSASNHLPLHPSYHRTAACTALVQSAIASWVLPMGLVKTPRICCYLHVYVLLASICPTDSMALVLDSIPLFPISLFPLS